MAQPFTLPVITEDNAPPQISDELAIQNEQDSIGPVAEAQNQVDPVSARQKATDDASFLGADPEQLYAEVRTNGTHSLSMEVDAQANARAREKLNKSLATASKKLSEGTYTKAELDELRAQYNTVTLSPDENKQVGRFLKQVDTAFDGAAAPRTPAGQRIQQAKKDAVEDWATKKERIATEMAEASVGKGALVTATKIGEVVSWFVPFLGTGEDVTIAPALARAYTAVSGQALTAAQVSDLATVYQALRGELDKAKELPTAAAQEKEVRRINSIILDAIRESGVTQKKMSQVDVLRDISNESIIEIGDKRISSDSIARYGFAAVLGFGVLGGVGVASGLRKAFKRKIIKDIADGKVEASALTRNIKAMTVPAKDNTLGPVLKNLTPPQVAPAPFNLTDLRGSEVGAGIDEYLVELEQRTQDASRVQMNAQLFTPLEQDALILRAQDKIAEGGGAVIPQYTEIVARDNAGFRMAALVGQSGSNGWESAVDALYFADGNLPLDSVTLLRRDLATGEFAEVSRAELDKPQSFIGAPGEWFLKLDHQYKYNPEDRALFGPEAAVHYDTHPQTIKFFLEPASRFSKKIMDFARGATNQESAIKEAGNSLLAGNFLKLNATGRAKVMRVLDDGDKQGKEFSVAQLDEYDLSDKEMKAYYEARAFNRFIYEHANRNLRGRMERDGWRAMYRLNGTGAPSFVKVVTSLDELPDAIYDPVRKTFVNKIEADAIAKARGGSIVKLKDAAPVGDNPLENIQGVYTHVISDSDHIIDDLPVSVLNYNPGQITRIYDENFFLRVTEPEYVNGVQVPGKPKVLAVGRTFGELERAREEMQATANPGQVFEVTRDEKALRALATGAYDFDVQGALLTSGRGTALTRIDKSPARILDPFNAMNVARDVVAGRAAWDDFFSEMKVLAAETWPNDIEIDDTGVLVLKGSETTGTNEEAVQFKEWLDSLQETNNKAGIRFQQRMVHASERLQRSKSVPKWIADPIARALAEAPQADVVRFARSTTFVLQVAMAGPRVLLMNALQPLFLMGIAPVSSLRALALDQWALQIAMANRDNPALDNMLAQYLKAAGLGTGDVQTYKAAMEAYRMSGLPYSLDSHAFFRGTKLSPEIKSDDGTMTEVLKRLVTVAPRAATAMFRGGEQINLASTFMVATRRYLRKNPKADTSDPRVWGDIASEARALTLDMSKANDLAYQKGYLAIPFQYYAILHKALNMMLTNKTLTGAERAGIMGMSALVYGAAGFPFGEQIVEDAMEALNIDLSKYGEADAIEIRNTIHGGMVDRMWNNVFTENDGTPGSAKVSDSLSMVQGIINMVRDQLDNEHSVADLFGGATYGQYSAFKRVHDEILYIAGERTDLDTEEKILKAMAVAPEVISGWSRYAKAQFGMEMSAAVNKNFKPTVRASERDLWNKGIFGFSSYREAEAYVLQRKQQDADEAFKADVELAGKQMVRILMSYDADYDAAHAEMDKFRTAYVTDQYNYKVWNTALKNIFMPAQAAVVAGMPKDKSEELIKKLVRSMRVGTVAEDGMAAYVMNTDAVLRMSKEDQDALRSALQSAEQQMVQGDASSADYGYEEQQ